MKEVVGQQFERWKSFNIHNPYESQGSVYISEESVTKIGEQVFKKDLRNILITPKTVKSVSSDREYTLEDLFDVIDSFYAALK
jgi:virulence-associated protein VapD